MDVVMGPDSGMRGRWLRAAVLLGLLGLLGLASEAAAWSAALRPMGFQSAAMRTSPPIGSSSGDRRGGVAVDLGAATSGAGPAAVAGVGVGAGVGRAVGERRALTTMLAERQRIFGGRGRRSRPLPYPVRFAVLGGGSFGLALASVLGRKSIPVTILLRKQEVADHLNAHHKHPTYLSDIALPPSVRATADPEEALKDATFIIHAVPVQYSRKFLEGIAAHMPKNTPVISTSKGIETGTLCMMQDILEETLGPDREIAYLSGPSFAREIALGLVTAVVVASESEALADEVCDIMGSDVFRVFTSTDVVGVEVGGAVKNVIAIAAGMCEGLGLGTNAMSALVTRGCNEMQRLALSLGARPTTLTGLSGVGDTFGTCFGPLSRNRNLGVRLGKGESLDSILGSSTEVAEGVATAFSLVQLIEKTNRGYRRELSYPIIFGVKEILEGKRTPAEGLRDLMAMPVRVEMWNL